MAESLTQISYRESQEESKSEKNENEEYLKIYYSRVMPLHLIRAWLNYGEPSKLPNREFCFVLEAGQFIRHLSFKDDTEIRTKLIQRLPVTICVSEIFDIPAYLYHSEMTILEKELVFDIDISDYNDVRTCCKESNICQKCWKFMIIAAEILDEMFRTQFAFQHILWVFSGRRGIHAWVCDKEVRKYSVSLRVSIGRYIQILNTSNKKIRIPNRVSHKLSQAVKIIDNYIIEIIKEQKILENEEQIEKFLLMVHTDLRATFKAEILKGQSNLERWNNFLEHHSYLQKNGQLPKTAKNLVTEVKLQIGYPRIDIRVTTDRSHLVKIPFSVHRKTFNLSLPLAPDSMGCFNLIEDIVNIKTLCEKNKDNDFESVVSGFHDLAYKSLRYFTEFIYNLYKSEGKNISDIQPDLDFFEDFTPSHMVPDEVFNIIMQKFRDLE